MRKVRRKQILKPVIAPTPLKALTKKEAKKFTSKKKKVDKSPEGWHMEEVGSRPALVDLMNKLTKDPKIPTVQIKVIPIGASGNYEVLYYRC